MAFFGDVEGGFRLGFVSECARGGAVVKTIKGDAAVPCSGVAGWV